MWGEEGEVVAHLTTAGATVRSVTPLRLEQAAVALQSNQFVERMRKSRETEMQFLDVVTDVTSEIDLTALLQKVMGEATRLLNAERSTLFLNDEKTKELIASRVIHILSPV